MVNISITQRRKTEAERMHFTPVERRVNWWAVIAWGILVGGSILGWTVVILMVIQRLGWFYGG